MTSPMDRIKNHLVETYGAVPRLSMDANAGLIESSMTASQ